LLCVRQQPANIQKTLGISREGYHACTPPEFPTAMRMSPWTRTRSLAAPSCSERCATTYAAGITASGPSRLTSAGLSGTSCSAASGTQPRWPRGRSSHSSPIFAVARNVAASTRNQALNALVFLYKQVLGREDLALDNIAPAKHPQRLPAVFDRSEIESLLLHLEGTPKLVAALLYGTGLRLDGF